MSAQTERLGGRLPLLEPSALSAAQKETYERLSQDMGIRGPTTFLSRASLRTGDL